MNNATSMLLYVQQIIFEMFCHLLQNEYILIDRDRTERDK